jgi:orotate phosphoribosyltransferase
MIIPKKTRLNSTARELLEASINDMRDLIYIPKTNLVAETLVKSGSYHVDLQLPPEKWFRWKSGIIAPCICDCKGLNRFPHYRKIIDISFIKSVKFFFPEADYIVGIATAGISWAKTIAESLNLPLAYVRRTAKEIGKGDRVECSPQDGTHAIIIDDVIASGKSVMEAIRFVNEETNLKVVGILSIVNWNFTIMRNYLNSYNIRSLTSYPFILSLAFREGLIDEKDFTQLMTFYKSPGEHVWATHYDRSLYDD